MTQSVRNDGLDLRGTKFTSGCVDGDELLAVVALAVALRAEVHTDAHESLYEHKETERDQYETHQHREELAIGNLSVADRK
jgi:hypothetical protein